MSKGYLKAIVRHYDGASSEGPEPYEIKREESETSDVFVDRVLDELQYSGIDGHANIHFIGDGVEDFYTCFT